MARRVDLSLDDHLQRVRALEGLVADETPPQQKTPPPPLIPPPNPHPTPADPIYLDIDVPGTGPKGLSVVLLFRLP